MAGGQSRLQRLGNEPELAGELGRFLRPLRLVAGVGGNPPCRAPVGVEHRDHIAWSPIDDQAGQHLEEAAHGVDRAALRVGDGLRPREEGSVAEAGGVEEKALGGHARPSCPEQTTAATDARRSKVFAPASGSLRTR